MVDGPVDYDTFARSPRATQVGVFNAITPKNRAQIVRTQVERWLAANRATLNAEQIEAVEAAVSIIAPELYDPAVEDERKRAIIDPVYDRIRKLLTREQVAHCLGAGAPHIPPQPDQERATGSACTLMID